MLEFTVTKPLEFGKFTLNGVERDFVSSGNAVLSGISYPHESCVEIMGILYSTVRDIVREFYGGISITMLMPKRMTPNDDYRFEFCIDYCPPEASGEGHDTYNKRCVDNFSNVCSLYEMVITAFVRDPEGLDALIEYLDTTDDPDNVKVDHAKAIRDHIMLKHGFRTRSQIKAKARIRHAQEAKTAMRQPKPPTPLRKFIGKHPDKADEA